MNNSEERIERLESFRENFKGILYFFVFLGVVCLVILGINAVCDLSNQRDRLGRYKNCIKQYSEEYRTDYVYMANDMCSYYLNKGD